MKQTLFSASEHGDDCSGVVWYTKVSVSTGHDEALTGHDEALTGHDEAFTNSA